jgi:hypothetical protein
MHPSIGLFRLIWLSTTIFKFTVEYTNGREPELDCEVYLYRVGRAGRFGSKGKFLKLFAWLCCVVNFCLLIWSVF